MEGVAIGTGGTDRHAWEFPARSLDREIAAKLP